MMGLLVLFDMMLLMLSRIVMKMIVSMLFFVSVLMMLVGMMLSSWLVGVIVGLSGCGVMLVSVMFLFGWSRMLNVILIDIVISVVSVNSVMVWLLIWLSWCGLLSEVMFVVIVMRMMGMMSILMRWMNRLLISVIDCVVLGYSKFSVMLMMRLLIMCFYNGIVN